MKTYLLLESVLKSWHLKSVVKKEGKIHLLPSAERIEMRWTKKLTLADPSFVPLTDPLHISTMSASEGARHTAIIYYDHQCTLGQCFTACYDRLNTVNEGSKTRLCSLWLTNINNTVQSTMLCLFWIWRGKSQYRYQSLIRPALEYASTTWSPNLKKDINALTLTLWRCFNEDDGRGPKPGRNFQFCCHPRARPPDLPHAKRTPPSPSHDSQVLLGAVYYSWAQYINPGRSILLLGAVYCTQYMYLVDYVIKNWTSMRQQKCLFVGFC